LLRYVVVAFVYVCYVVVDLLLRCYVYVLLFGWLHAFGCRLPFVGYGWFTFVRVWLRLVTLRLVWLRLVVYVWFGCYVWLRLVYVWLVGCSRLTFGLVHVVTFTLLLIWLIYVVVVVVYVCHVGYVYVDFTLFCWFALLLRCPFVVGYV